MVLLVAINSCTDDNVGSGNLTISGQLDNLNEQTEIYLSEFSNGDYATIDTANIDEDGSFELNSTIKGMGFFQLGFSRNNSMNLLLQPGENIQLSADANALITDYSISGSPGSSDYLKLILNQVQLQEKMDSLNQIKSEYSQNRDMQGFASVIQQQKQIYTSYQNEMRAFIDDNPNSLANLVAIEQLDIEQDLPYYEKVLAALQPKIATTTYYSNLENKVNSVKATTVGSIAPDIALPNPEGEEIKLSDLRGSYVLLDFWASWCKPCRAENPNVVEMFEKYKNEGFTVFSVSLDGVPQQGKNGKAQWLKAIEQDNLVWPYHVSDLQGWKSVAAQSYNVNSIPFSLLLNPEGEIVAKNLRGQELRDKLKELLG